MPRTPTLPPTDPQMWTRLLNRLYLLEEDALFRWATTVRGAVLVAEKTMPVTEGRKPHGRCIAAKINQRAQKKKKQIAIQAAKKAGGVDVQAVKKKVQARIKGVKKRGK